MTVKHGSLKTEPQPISVLELHVHHQGQAGLVAQWLVNQDDKAVLARHRRYQSPASKTDATQPVAALNQGCNQLS